MIDDYEEGELERIYLAKVFGLGSAYYVEATKKRLLEEIRECEIRNSSGSISEQDRCRGHVNIEFYEIILKDNIRKIGEFPNESLDEILEEDENGCL